MTSSRIRLWCEFGDSFCSGKIAANHVLKVWEEVGKTNAAWAVDRMWVMVRFGDGGIRWSVRIEG